MRIAIVGAGLSGLACAHELERLGFTPDIFEKRHRVGERFPNVETMAQFFHMHPRQDIFLHLRHDLNLPVNPISMIRSAVLHSESHEATIRGPFGYTTVRGHDERSLERQLERHLRSPIRFGTNPDVRELQREYDWVVVATGDQEWTRDLHHWTRHIAWWVRGAHVTGDFDPTELHFFFNTRYAKTGYAMIAPMDERHASVGIAVPHSSADEVDRYWQVFREGLGHFWEEEEIQFKLEKFECGAVAQHVIGNVVLIGNAGGFVEGLGIAGQCPSMASGVHAARQIVLNDNSLDRYVRQWRAHYNRFWRLRRTVNAWTDVEMDLFVQMSSSKLSGLVARAPFSMVVPAAFAADLFRLPDDLSPEVGPD